MAASNIDIHAIVRCITILLVDPWMAVPLEHNDRVEGLLYLDSTRANFFDDQGGKHRCSERRSELPNSRHGGTLKKGSVYAERANETRRTQQDPPRSTVESRPGAAITVRRIEMSRQIKAAISARIAATKDGSKVSR